MNVSKSVLLLASVTTACAALAEPGELISLTEGIAPLASRFNNQQDRAQVVARVIRREVESDDAEAVTFPDTSVGRIAQAFIEAFNSGDANKMRVFSEKHRSKSALEDRSMEDRLEQYRELHGDWGQLTVRNVESHDARSLTVTVKPQRGFSGLAMTFQCETAPPHKLEQIRITPAFLDDGEDGSSGEEEDKGKMGDVTVLTESLNPLRDHFNANRNKHRVIAILSPT